VGLYQDHDVIEAFASDAPEKSFAHRIHQGSLNRGAQDANPGACGDAVEDGPELIVAIADDELRPLPEGRRVAQLLRGPRLRRRARHGNVHDTLGVHVDDEEREDGPEPYVIGLLRNHTVWACDFLSTRAQAKELSPLANVAAPRFDTA